MHGGRWILIAWGACLTLGAHGARASAGPCAEAGRPLIAEVFYDASGDDTAREFVELFNPGPFARALAGVRLEAGDGSGPGRWTLRWIGLSGDTIPPLGRFVIGGVQVTPTPDAIAGLDLQNGPDAVRLVWPDGAVEVVGYGAHEFAEYFCLAPATDVASGQSLARIPDDVDQGGNLADLRAAAPSPGAPNQVRRDLALRADSLRADPEQPPALAPWRLGVTIVNDGVETITADEARLRVTALSEAGSLADAPLDMTLAASGRVERWLSVAGLAAGKHALSVSLALAGDARAGNDSARFVIRVGPGPLAITEIQFHPVAGEGEWVEVLARGPERAALGEFRVADRQLVPGTPHGGLGDLWPGDYAVLAQDRRALLARYPGLDSTRVWSVSPWPSLNNGDDASGIADVVALREADGTAVERVAYSAALAPAGFPLERAEGDVWVPASRPEGTPLAPPRLVPEARGGFEVEPRRLSAEDGGWLRWRLPWPRARVIFELYDLAGRRRAILLPETLMPGLGERAWKPTDQASGLYVVVLKARPEDGGDTQVAHRPVQIGTRP